MSKKIEKIERILIIILLIGLCGFVAYLYYMELYHYNFEERLYVSDLPLHFDGAIQSPGNGYSLNSFLIYWSYQIFHSKLIVVAGMVGLIIATYFVNYYVVTLFLNNNNVNINLNKKLLLSLVPLFMTSIYLPKVYELFYVRTFGGALWHNETYIEMRVMSMIVLVVFFRIVKHYLEAFSFKEWIALTTVLTITNAFKPNFILGFAPIVAFILFKDLVVSFNDKKKIKRIFAMGMTVLVSLVVLLLQSTKLFNNANNQGDAHGIKLEIGAFMTDEIWLQIILGLAPALCVLGYCIYKKDFPKWYGVLLGMTVLNFVIKYSFVETGERYADANFGWGFRNSIYLLNFASLLLLVKGIYMARKNHICSVKEKGFLMFCIFIFLASIISGCTYFCMILSGKPAWGI